MNKNLNAGGYVLSADLRSQATDWMKQRGQEPFSTSDLEFELTQLGVPPYHKSFEDLPPAMPASKWEVLPKIFKSYPVAEPLARQLIQAELDARNLVQQPDTGLFVWNSPPGPPAS